MRARRARKIFSYLLISGGAFFLFIGGRDLVDSRLGQSQAEREFQASPAFRPSPFVPSSRSKAEAAQVAGELRLGDTVARLTIPRLATDLYVVEGDGDGELRQGPGHLRGTAMPGANGNCIIAGHRDTHFRALKDIRQGDEIILQTRDGEYTYRVRTTQIVSPRDTKSLRPTSDAELHLVTCYPFYYLGSAPKRFIVDAQLENGPATGISSRYAPSAARIRPSRPRS